MKETVGSELGRAAIAPKALFLCENRLPDKKSIEYRKEYVKDFFQTALTRVIDA
jgi:hypothetical protein